VRFSNKVFAVALAGVLAGFSLAISASVSTASAIGLDGVWIGSGYAQPNAGQRERLQCRVTYSRMNDTIYNVVAICATTAARIRQTGELVMVRPGLFVGDFNNQQYDISGRVRVSLEGNAQSVTFSNEAGQGSLSLRRRCEGASQTC